MISLPPWAVIGLTVLATIMALSIVVANVALIRVTGKVHRLEHQVCLLEHRFPSCHLPP